MKVTKHCLNQITRKKNKFTKPKIKCTVATNVIMRLKTHYITSNPIFAIPSTSFFFFKNKIGNKAKKLLDLALSDSLLYSNLYVFDNK